MRPGVFPKRPWRRRSLGHHPFAGGEHSPRPPPGAAWSVACPTMVQILWMPLGGVAGSAFPKVGTAALRSVPPSHCRKCSDCTGDGGNAIPGPTWHRSDSHGLSQVRAGGAPGCRALCIKLFTFQRPVAKPYAKSLPYSIPFIFRPPRGSYYRSERLNNFHKVTQL